MVYQLPFINTMLEMEFQKKLHFCITTDNTFNFHHDFTYELINDQTVIFNRAKRIVSIDKDNQYITFEFHVDETVTKVGQQIIDMVKTYFIAR